MYNVYSKNSIKNKKATRIKGSLEDINILIALINKLFTLCSVE